MVDLAEIQAAYYMVAATGVLVAAIYYIMSLRNNNKTRQAQLLNSIQRDISDYQGWLRGRELSYMKWSSYDDFERKYGSDNNPTAYAMRLTNWYWQNNLGVMLKQRLVDEDMVYDTFGSSIIISWIQWETIIKEQRVRYMGPNWMDHFEYLANRMKNVQKKRGISWEPKETLLSYVPDAKN
jgi:hypothetical protein